MDVKQIIPAFAQKSQDVLLPADRCLLIAEFFCDSIQGEGIHMGHPAAFLRLAGCTLNCTWCDTTEVWRHGNLYSFDEIFQLIEDNRFGLVSLLKNGHHLVVTGGSPLLQQIRLIDFFNEFYGRYHFMPYIEIENECVLMPDKRLSKIVACWNNSPKLSNSGNKRPTYQPEVIRVTADLYQSWFKFVINSPEDWEEIQMNYLDEGLIFREQIILMPQGATRDELEVNKNMVLSVATKHKVRYSTRLHIDIWDKKISV